MWTRLWRLSAFTARSASPHTTIERLRGGDSRVIPRRDCTDRAEIASTSIMHTNLASARPRCMADVSAVHPLTWLRCFQGEGVTIVRFHRIGGGICTIVIHLHRREYSATRLHRVCTVQTTPQDGGWHEGRVGQPFTRSTMHHAHIIGCASASATQ